MIKIMIPRHKYWISDYPNLDSKADGRIMPDFFGQKTNITPVCVDTTTLRYKIANCDIRAIFSIDAIRAGINTLVSGVDYTPDLPNGEFTIKGTPKLQPNTTYYFVLEGDWAINGTDRIQFYGWNNAYPDGNAFEIDGGGVWTPLTNDITFVIFGKNSMDGTEEVKVSYTSGATYAPVKLRDHVDRTKIAMSFKTPNDGQSFYITKIIPGGNRNAGFPGGTVYMTIYSDQGITQVGIKSLAHTHFSEANNNIRFSFPQRGGISEFLVDAKGYVDAGLVNLMDNGSDILKFILNYRLNMADATLDLGAFAAFKADHTEPIAIYMDREMKFNEFIEKLEGTQLFKFLPKLDGKHAPIHYTSYDPAGEGCVLHLPMVKGSGDTVYDKSGEGNNGTIVGAQWAASEISKWCLDFDGDDDFVNIPHDDVFNLGTGSMSMCGWAKFPTEANNYGDLVGKGGWNYALTYGLLNSNGSIHGYLAKNGGADRILTGGYAYSVDEWHYYVVVFDRTNDRMILYVDGDEYSNVDISAYSAVSFINAFAVTIGMYPSWYTKGSIDEVRIYNRALTEDEVKAIYLGVSPHLQEEDFLPGFSCERRLSSVKQKYQISYNRNPTTDEYIIKEVESDIAKFFYRNEETLQVSTYLKDAADATALLNSYKALLEYPERWIHFPARNYGLDQIPTEKVKITRARGDNSGGSFDAILFRIMKLQKAISDGIVTFDTQLDSQTY